MVIGTTSLYLDSKLRKHIIGEEYVQELTVQVFVGFSLRPFVVLVSLTGCHSQAPFCVPGNWSPSKREAPQPAPPGVWAMNFDEPQQLVDINRRVHLRIHAMSTLVSSSCE